MARTDRTRPVTAAETRAFLTASEEFLASAKRDLSDAWYRAAVSSAIHAGINGADAICGARLAKRSAGAHDAAARLLELAGADGKAAARHLRRLLARKTKAEYDPEPVSRSAADASLKAATAIVETARRAVFVNEA